jgi:hypothetical protein
MHSPPRQGPEISGFLAAFLDFLDLPSIEHGGHLSTHRSAAWTAGDSVPETRPQQSGPLRRIAVIESEGPVAALSEPSAPSGYQAFNRLMDARAATRRAANLQPGRSLQAPA